MKKLLSIILSLVMMVSVGALSVTAFAETVGSIETTEPVTKNKIIPQVNGNNSNDVTWEWVSENPKQIKFTYTGDGTLESWDFGDLEEGVDYKVIDEGDNTITIELLDQNYDGDIIANAVVDEEEEETTKAGTTTKQNKSQTSPKTGAAAAAGIAAMGAGVAILTALKKKED